MTQGALNLGSYSYYDQNQPYIDLMKQTDSGWSGLEYPASPYANAADWLIGVPNGVSALTSAVYTYTVALASQFASIRTGDYFMTWSGNATIVVQADPALTVSGGGYGLVSPGRFKFSVNDGTSANIRYAVTNTSGSNVDVLDLVIVHSANEALHNAGEIFDPAFLSSLVGSRAVRIVDWAAANTFGFSPFAAVTNFSDIHLESDAHWGNSVAGNRQRVPPSVLGKLGLKTGRDLWINTPWKATDACLTSYYQAIYNTGFAGLIYSEAGNEPWNPTASYAWLRDTLTFDSGGGVWKVKDPEGVTRGNVVDVNGNPSSADVDRIICASADRAAASWTAAEAVFGQARVRRVYNTAAVSTGFGAFYEYTDPRSGMKIKDLLNNTRGRVAIAPYFYISTTAALPDISKRGLCDAKAYNNPDSDWRTSMQTYINNNIAGPSGWISTHLAYMQARSPQCVLTSYECGETVTVANPEPASQITVTVDAVLNQLTISSGSFAASYDNAEQTYLDFFIYSVQGLLTRTPYVKKNGTTGLQLFTDAALTNRITLAAQAGTFAVDNYTRMLLLDTKIKNYFDGAIGRTTYETDYFPAFVGKMEMFTPYTSSGGRSVGAQWGWKSNPLVADTPALVWFRGLSPDVTPGLQETPGAKGKRKKKIRGPYSDPRIYDEYIKKTIAEREGKPEQNVALAVVQEALVAQIEERQQTGYEEPAALSMENQLLSRLAELESKNKRLVSKVHARQHQIDAQLEQMKQEEEVTRNILILLHEL